VSNDCPFSEAQFKTLKYLPNFPDRFESLAHARQFCAATAGESSVRPPADVAVGVLNLRVVMRCRIGDAG